MEKLIRAFDWSKTSLGPLENWSDNFQSAVRNCLTANFPAFVCGGPELIVIYNDLYIPIVAGKHPDKMFTRPLKEGRREIWSTLEPIIKQVMETGKPVGREDLLLPINRHGFAEEYYCTVSYMPIGTLRGKFEGIFTTVINTTARIIQTRHLQTLKELEAHIKEARSSEEVCRLAAEILSKNDADIPFALLYLLDTQHKQAHLQGTTRLEPGTIMSPVMISAAGSADTIWPLARVINMNKVEVIDVSQFSSLPSGRWDIKPRQAILIPIAITGQKAPVAIFIAGVSAMRVLDEDYRNFYHSIVALIAAALIKSEQKYRLLAIVSPVGILHISKEGHISSINPRGREIIGMPTGKLSTDVWFQAVHPDDRERVRALWNKTINGEVERFKAEYRFSRPDGSLVWGIGEFVPEKDSNDTTLQGYIGTLTDITELKVLEAAHQEQQRQRAEDAETNRKRQTQLIETLCHELLNPLNGILGNVDLLLKNQEKLEATLHKIETTEELKGDLREQLLQRVSCDKEAMEAINKCAHYQKIITDDMRDFFRLEAGKVTLCEKNLDPQKVIHDTVAMLETDIKRKKLQLQLKLPDQAIVVKGDPDRLIQVLMNLLSNAVKFTPENGKITVFLNQIAQTNENRVLQFSVKDTGIGISADEKAKLFDRYFQAGRHTHSEYGGSGLGLAISKNLVELMGGKIEVVSEKWQGSQFTFTVTCKTLAKEEKPVAASESSSVTKLEQTPKAGLTVLIVEDNLINQKILKKQLAQADYHCHVANHGQEALAIFEKTPIDIILMDVEMPVMNGLAATKAIRALEKSQECQRPLVPIIGLSGNACQEQIDEAIRAGMNDYLTKPYEKNQLLEKIAYYTQDRTAAKAPMTVSSPSANPASRLALQV